MLPGKALLLGTVVALAALAILAFVLIERGGSDGGPASGPGPGAGTATVVALGTPAPLPQMTDGARDLRSSLLTAAGALYRSARQALTNETFCGTCGTGQSIESMTHDRVEAACGKLVSPEILRSPDYNPAVHEPLASTLIGACAQLQAFPPDDTYKANVAPIVKRLEQMLLYEHAREPAAADQTQYRPQPQPRAPGTPLGFYPLGTHTGIAAVNHTLDLLYADDVAAVVNEAAFVETPCSFLATIGVLDCAVGEPEGTVHRTIGIGSCEPGLAEPGDFTG